MTTPAPPAPSVAIVFGTFNRFALLRRAVASVRCAVGDLPYEIIVVDGGSTDGTRQWLTQQRDVTLIQQEGPLTGAVAAFNLGFGRAVDAGHAFVMHLNDDAEIVSSAFGPQEPVGNRPLPAAVHLMTIDPTIGEVAFALDLRGDYGYEHINGVPYANFGVIRREAGMAVARAQGDATGRAWWNPIYRTYGADTELGVWLWKLGYSVHTTANPAKSGLFRVHDANAADALRAANHDPRGKTADSELFWSRWRNENLAHLPSQRRVTSPRPTTATPPRTGSAARGRAGETPRRR